MPGLSTLPYRPMVRLRPRGAFFFSFSFRAKIFGPLSIRFRLNRRENRAGYFGPLARPLARFASFETRPFGRSSG
jgi:hypothetical protein